MSERLDIAVFLSAPPKIARRELQSIRAEHGNDKITVFLRERHRGEFQDLLDGCFAYSDKPSGSKAAYLAELRSHFYHRAYVLDYGQWDYFPARCLIFAVRANEKTVVTERGRFALRLWRPTPLVRHIMHRTKNRTGPVANMPPGTPLPFACAIFRKTFGRLFGGVVGIARYAARRL